MGTLGTRWIDEHAGTAPLGADLDKRTAAALRALTRGGYTDELKAAVAAYNRDQQPAPAPVVHPLWSGFGWVLEKFSDLWDPATLKASGITWAAACLHHGFNADGSQNLSSTDAASQAWLAAGNAQAYRAAGIKVGGWAWHERVPESEADVADICIKNWGLDFWIANAEQTWKQEPGGVVNAAERYARRLHPLVPAGYPVAWSPLGAAAGDNVFPYDYKAFTERGWHVLPQAYPQQSPEYALSLCLDHSERAGIAKRLVHCTIANYAPQKAGAFKPSITEWATELGRARARGYLGASLWDQPWTPDEVRTLAAAARG